MLVHVDAILPRYHRVRVHIIEQFLSHICRIFMKRGRCPSLSQCFYGYYRIYRVCWPFANSTY